MNRGKADIVKMIRDFPGPEMPLGRKATNYQPPSPAEACAQVAELLVEALGGEGTIEARPAGDAVIVKGRLHEHLRVRAILRSLRANK